MLVNDVVGGAPRDLQMLVGHYEIMSVTHHLKNRVKAFDTTM